MAKVLIVGGGAAGLMAAGAAVRQGHEVTVLEHMEKPGQKILVTGKGRCNVTNDCTAEEFLRHVRTNPRFLFSSLGAFPPARTMELFEGLGVELKVERGRRVFPVSDRAEEIRQALLRYAEEDEDYYSRYCARRGLHREQIMEFEYRLLVNRDSPLARHEVHDLAELNRYTEVLHDDFQRPGEEGSSLRWQVNENRRVHVYERCSQFSILQSLPTAYMWASPMPQRALEQYHLVLKKCPAQNQRMRDVLVYPDKGGLRPEEEKFIELLRRQAALTVK